jgi:multiple antibiotic resistance protein
MIWDNSTPMLEIFATSFATLFVMVDPIGLTPMFAALTANRPLAERSSIAARSVFVAAILLVLFGVIGDWLLHTIGVSLPAFRIAGGIMLFLLSVEMLFQKRSERREKTADGQDQNDPSIFPLATPLIAGPGAMAAMILLTSQNATLTAQTPVFAALFTVLAICYVTFLSTELIERILRPTGIMVLTRLFGVLLSALAVQFILDGAMEFWAVSGV